MGDKGFLFFTYLFFGDVKGAIVDGEVVVLFVLEVKGLVSLLDGLAGLLPADEAGLDVFEAGIVFIFHLVQVFLHN